MTETVGRLHRGGKADEPAAEQGRCRGDTGFSHPGGDSLELAYLLTGRSLSSATSSASSTAALATLNTAAAPSEDAWLGLTINTGRPSAATQARPLQLCNSPRLQQLLECILLTAQDNATITLAVGKDPAPWRQAGFSKKP